MERRRGGSRWWAILATGAAAALLAPRPARSAPEVPHAATGAVHVGRHVLDLAAGIALGKVPHHLDLAPLDKDLGLCGMKAQVTSAYVDLVPKTLAFTPADGALSLSTSLDLSGYAHVRVDKGYACLATAECDVAFSARDLALGASVELQIAGGKPTAGLGAVSAQVPNGQLHLEFGNCAFDNLSSGLVDKLAAELLILAQGPLGDRLRAEAPPLLEAQLGALIGKPVTGAVQGYGLAAQLTELAITKEGIDAYAAIGVGYDGAPAACLPPEVAAAAAPRAPTDVGAALALPRGPTSSLVIGVSTTLLSSALDAAWRSGLLCTDDAAIRALGFDPDQLAMLVPGMPKGFGMHMAMALDAPPSLEVGAAGDLRMRVRGAEMLVSMSSPDQPTTGMAVSTDFTVGIRPSVDPGSGTVYAELTALSMEHLEIHAGPSGLAFDLDPERLGVLMQDLVLPMAAGRLRGMPLAPAALGAAGFYGWLTDVSARDGGVYVGLEAFQPGPASDDVAPPETLLQKTPGPLVRAGMARFQVSGSDDRTPAALLRYEWQVDDGPISAAAFQRVVTAPVTTAGRHVFRVRAVDLTDKRASTWVQHDFELDPVAPTIQFLEEPSVSVRATSTRLRFTGSDDRTPTNLLNFAYRLEARAPGGDLHVVRTADATGFDGDGAEIAVDGLESGTVYDLTVLLYDQAGNVTSKKISFAANDPGGCAVTGGPLPSLATLLLVALALFCARRARPILS